MIQRIQTLYLLIVIVLVSLLFFLPSAKFFVGPDIYEFFTSKVVLISGEASEFITWNPMSFALTVISLLMAIFCIFLYRRRYLQARLCIVNMVLQLGLFVLMWLQISSMNKEIEAVRQFSIAFSFPLICVVLLWLATRGILKDIVLLKSYDRIR